MECSKTNKYKMLVECAPSRTNRLDFGMSFVFLLRQAKAAKHIIY